MKDLCSLFAAEQNGLVKPKAALHPKNVTINLDLSMNMCYNMKKSISLEILTKEVRL